MSGNNGEGLSAWQEGDRLDALDRYDILDTASEAEFDDIAKIAAQLCNVPIALISLVDDKRQWFKAAVGMGVSETPRDISFCAQAIGERGVFIVPDATKDVRFSDNPLVTGNPHIRFYAGAPLETSDGFPLGTLCVLDTKPRELTAEQHRSLQALARQVMTQMELRQALKHRRSDEQRHRLILESAVDYAIISMDLRGIVTSWNEGARRIFQWTEDEMCGNRCDVFFTPEDRKAGVPDREMGAALTRGRGTDERWHLRKDGGRFWANGEMMPLTDDNDNPVGFIKILRDRTVVHHARKALEASEQRFQLALSAAGFLGSWDWDVAADRIYPDRNFAKTYGLVGGDAGVTMEAFVDLVHPADRDRITAEFRQCIDKCSEFAEEYRLLAGDGTVRWVFARGQCFRDEDGGNKRFPGVAVEITDRKNAEEALLASETRTRLAIEAADLGIWSSTAALRELRWDARTRELLGHSPDEPLDYDTSFLMRVHPDDREAIAEANEIALAPGGTGTLDHRYRIVNEDGSIRWLHARGRLIEGATGLDSYVGTIRDISAEKAAEEHRQLLANELQHRIKNTLAVVQAIVSQSLRTVATPTEARDAIGERLASLGRAHDLLTDTSWTAAPIAAIVENSMHTAKGGNSRIHAFGPDIRLGARAALALTMALHELSTNAVKYGALSNETGRVDLRWSITGVGDDATFDLIWQESGGPTVTPPVRKGFGSRLIESGLARDLGGKTSIGYDPGGVTWTVSGRLGDVQD